MFANNAWGVMENYVLVAIPLFILMAQLLDRSKVSDKLFEALYVVLGSIKGGLGLAVVVVCTIFAATTGIIGASVVAMGLLATPALLRKNYQKEMTSGIICAAGTLGILIPPSIMMVVYGGLTGLKETTVGNLFAGAIFPGLLLAGLYFAYILIRCNINPTLGPPISKEEAGHIHGRPEMGHDPEIAGAAPGADPGGHGYHPGRRGHPHRGCRHGGQRCGHPGIGQPQTDLAGIPGQLPRHPENHRHGDDAVYRR
jgi:TRAP-type mannitol/chloroaromatic compound transport system permease large subunit